ncbi:MAG: hypothetical protein KAS38_20835 [Anaerolineales bacterium]|nr:hypothetical protein [Anaerolineales bacterium]
MQKWEHMVIRSYGGVVMHVNGQETAEIVGAQPVGEMLYEFLSGVGEDGWEVVGMAGVREGTEIVLKRPLIEDEEELEEGDEE